MMEPELHSKTGIGASLDEVNASEELDEMTRTTETKKDSLKRKLSEAFFAWLPSSKALIFGRDKGEPTVFNTDACIDDIPDEILVTNVFSYLDICDLGCAAQTCIWWDESLPSWLDTLSNMLWRELARKRWPDLTSSIVSSSELSSDSYNYRELCKDHLRSLNDTALFEPWTHVQRDILVGKPIKVHAIGWLVRNGHIEGSIEALSATTAPFYLIPPLFQRYEQPLLDQHDTGNVTDEVQFPEIPSNLSDKARRAHRQALEAVEKIYLDDEGYLKAPRPSFRYASDIALYLASSGSRIGPYDVHQECVKARDHAVEID